MCSVACDCQRAEANGLRKMCGLMVRQVVIGDPRESLGLVRGRRPGTGLAMAPLELT